MAWILKGEFEFLVSSLAERLDIAKCRGLLTSSLDMRLVCSRDPTFAHYYGAGKAYLGRYIEKHLNRTGLGLQSKYMHKSLGASIVDECNLAHIFQILRVEELLECNAQCLPVTVAASVLLAIVGELDAVRMDLLNMKKDVRELDNFRRESAQFLTDTLEFLVEFIVESGRDRFTYIKEALILPTATPPRPIPSLGQQPPKSSQKVASDLRSSDDPFSLAARMAQGDAIAEGSDGGQEYLTSLYALYRRGDLQLEILLNSGSILSIWRRLKALFELPRATAQDLIRWAVIRQAPRLNRLRQLIFTRLLQVLCNPSLRTGKIKGDVPDFPRKALKQDRAIAATVLSAFARSGVKAWCYESESQKLDIVRGMGGGEVSSKISSMLCIKVDRGFIDLPMDDNYFDEDTLERWFSPRWSETYPNQGRYSSLIVTDDNLYRLVPRKDKSDFGFGTASSLTSLVGGRMRGIVPDDVLSGEHRFFTAPLTTAFLDTEKFDATLREFFSSDDVC
ncbi:hypothetical protein TGCAST_209490 [Toxoplasma gondii CAST]|uniref:Uncharacterized protein n=1 Tax=Toxoplasma gondii CAST TaxID=943122 RepID=A0A3R7YN85_TOXGO|nr:hypothetical protein TGCAST_209490 [Toxoplasma gondii CAST]